MSLLQSLRKKCRKKRNEDSRNNFFIQFYKLSKIIDHFGAFFNNSLISELTLNIYANYSQLTYCF